MITCYKNEEWDAGDTAWLAIGTLMRKLARHHLWQYFRPGPFYNSNDPDTLLRTGFEAEPDIRGPAVAELEFRIDGGRNLFSELYDSLGSLFTVFRGLYDLAGVPLLDGGWWRMAKDGFAAFGSSEISAASRTFAANEQKINTESVALSQPSHSRTYGMGS